MRRRFYLALTYRGMIRVNGSSPDWKGYLTYEFYAFGLFWFCYHTPKGIER